MAAEGWCNMADLLQPLKVGAILAPNRIFMAPMTRARGTRDHVPTPMMVEYYRQRASAGLIVSEAIGISQQGLGWPYATGIWSPQQVEGWRQIVEAVHQAGGRIVAQLWHMGRAVHPSLLGGELPVSASATRAPGAAHTYEGKQPYESARELRIDEIASITDDYVRAAQNAMRAGFDGVQLHAANGYLIDQFLSDNSNFRSDDYGGSLENRLRLLLEVTRALAAEVGLERTGVRLSPNGEVQGVRDSQLVSTFRAAVTALSRLGIAFLELREPPTTGTFGKGDLEPLAAQLRPLFSGTLILNSDFDVARAQRELAEGIGDAVTFGRPFIANPDLPRRIELGLELAHDDRATWFTQGREGYADYPVRT